MGQGLRARPVSRHSARGEVEPTVGKYFAGGAPDLGVVIEVAGTVYGPSSVIHDSHRPIWDYTFPQPIAWKLGDPVTIRIIDYDWSASEVYVLNSQEGDPLAMKILSGTIKPAKGGQTSLVFASDFSVPTLSSARMSRVLDECLHVMIKLPPTVRFEQAVYGSFPFWHRGYAVFANRRVAGPSGLPRCGPSASDTASRRRA